LQISRSLIYINFEISNRIHYENGLIRPINYNRWNIKINWLRKGITYNASEFSFNKNKYRRWFGLCSKISIKIYLIKANA